MIKYHETALFDTSHKNDQITLILYVGLLIWDPIILPFDCIGNMENLDYKQSFIWTYMYYDLLIEDRINQSLC